MPSIGALLQVNAADRPLRAYAYLTTALRGQSNKADVLDCLIPFIRAGVEAQQNGAVLDIASLSSFLLSLGLHIPTLVLHQLTRRLEQAGALERRAGIYFVQHARLPESVRDADAFILDQAFDEIEREISQFAHE